MTLAFKQNKWDTFYNTIHTHNRSKFVLFHNDKIRKHDVMTEHVRHGVDCLIKETAACYFIIYYMGGLADIC